MAKTLVAVFDDMTSARSAVDALHEEGIAENQIQLMSNDQARASTSGETGVSWTDKVSNWFSSLFDNDDDRAQASHYAEAWRRGHYIVVADVDDDEVDEAATIMNRYGTVDIDRRAEYWKRGGYAGTFDPNAPLYTEEERRKELAGYPQDQPETEALPVVQEELALGKRVVQRGGVRIHSYIEERPVEEMIRLREERINVQRRPVDRPAGEADLAFQERTIDVPAMGEEPVVQKQARVVEEVVVNKEIEEREQAVQDKVRRKDVRVEKAPPAPRHR